MEVVDTDLPEVKILVPQRFRDGRGFFCETWNERRMAEAGIACRFVQDNQSVSTHAGTIRGLHLQRPPHAQDKLVRVGRGRIFDVAVDARRGSPTFGRWVGVELSAENGRQLFIPAGFAHGFCTLVPDTEVLYKASDFYSARHEAGVIWSDPDLAIPWPVDPGAAILSENDRKHPPLAKLAAG